MIMYVNIAVGKKHDFEILKETIKSLNIEEDTKIFADSGYQGLEHIHENSVTPFKKSKKQPLTEFKIIINRNLSKQRVKIEHVNREIKIFNMFGGVYRNKRNNFEKRINLVAAIVNMNKTAT